MIARRLRGIRIRLRAVASRRSSATLGSASGLNFIDLRQRSQRLPRIARCVGTIRYVGSQFVSTRIGRNIRSQLIRSCGLRNRRR